MSRQSHHVCCLTALGNFVWGTICSAQHTASACAALVGRQHVCCTITDFHAGAQQCSGPTFGAPRVASSLTERLVPCRGPAVLCLPSP